MKDKIGIAITSAFQKNVDESGCKVNKIWVDKGSKFYNRSMKSWLQVDDIKMFQHITKESLLLLKDLLEPSTKFTNIWLQYQKNVCIADMVNKYNSTYHTQSKWHLLM